MLTRDLVGGNACFAQCLEAEFDHRKFSGSLGGASAQHRSDVGMGDEGANQRPGQRHHPFLWGQAGGYLVEGHRQQPVADRTQQSVLVLEVPPHRGAVDAEFVAQDAARQAMGFCSRGDGDRRIDDRRGGECSPCHVTNDVITDDIIQVRLL